MKNTIASNYVLKTIGHHLIKWAMHRIRAGTMTAQQFAEQQAPNVRPGDNTRQTISTGIVELMHTKPEDLPITLR